MWQPSCLRPIQRWPRPSGLAQRWIGAEDENIVLIRFYRKKFTLAAVITYIDNQAKHHQHHSVREELEKFMKKHGIQSNSSEQK